MSSTRRSLGTGPSSSPSSPDTVPNSPRLLPAERGETGPTQDLQKVPTTRRRPLNHR
ncbi:hypothetical protein [Streptomyces sp. PA03-2a]|uniref:hypothetical protein n=1 Tax=Streptomyces sp. PA03-2a TaxID=3028701 RepID=UPI0029BC077E|nr:hypothetical protein [Streptomyces sp. PA03-2a]MDX2733560.1 hypothetical protein [Streptomyces sp. PA03-2a]